MDDKFLLGVGGAAGTCVAWNLVPGHEQFRMSALKATSTDGLETSPLAFIEHYHFGLASILATRFSSKKHSPYLYGFGAGMVGSELFQEKPFGVGKTPQEVQGNVALTMLLGAVLLATI